MKTLDEVLEQLQPRLDKPLLEAYIERRWVRPLPARGGWRFEEIDIARIELVCHLAQDLHINDEGMDVTLSLLDQMYALRTAMQRLGHALSRQPENVQAEIRRLLDEPLMEEE